VDLRSGEVGHPYGRRGGGEIGQHFGDLPGGDEPDPHPWSRRDRAGSEPVQDLPGGFVELRRLQDRRGDTAGRLGEPQSG
jgi:hypothetical protein